MPSLHKVHDGTSVLTPLPKKRGAWKQPLPIIDSSIFETADYLNAIGDVCDEDILPRNNSHYLTMGKESLSTVPRLPPPPDCSGMTPQTEELAKHDYMLQKKAYQRDKKAATDALRKARRAESGGRAVNWSSIEYSGDNSPSLCPRDLVCSCRLSHGQNFVDKDVVQMRIAEEAMLQGLEIHYRQSTNEQIIAEGDKFHVHASLNEKSGWVIKVANICSGDDSVGYLEDDVVDDSYDDDGESIDNDNDEDATHLNRDDTGGDDNDSPTKKTKEKPKPLRTPLSSNWIVPLIKNVMTEKPNTSNNDLHHILSPYCREYALTRGLLQKARDK
jgi:hypothetical protein